MKTKRLVIFLLEIIAALTVCLMVGVGILMARLDHGPLPLDNLTPEIESVLADLSPGLHFRIGNAYIESYSKRRAIRVHLEDIRVLNKDGKTIGLLNDVMLGFNWRNITGMTYLPIVIDVMKPSIEVTRYANGHIGFNLEEVAEEEKQALTFPELSDIIARMPRQQRRIRIVDAVIRYRDEIGDSRILFHDGLFEFSRFGDAVSGTMAVSVDSKNFTQRINGTIAYDPQEKKTHVVTALKALKLEQLRGLVTGIPDELQMTMPMDVLLTASVDRDMALSFAMQVAASKGALTYAPYYPEALTVDNVFANLFYYPSEKRIHLKNMALRMGDALLLAKGVVTENDDKQQTVALQAMVEDVPVDRLKLYWPQEAGKDARDWVVNQLSDGVAEQAVIDLALTRKPGEAILLDKMEGGITYRDITVNYLPPMPTVKGVSGHIVYDKQHFDIYANKGQLFDTVLHKGFVRINNLVQEDQDIQIDLHLEGPIRDAIETISSKPLEYAQELGLVPGQFSGTGKTHLVLAFPLEKDLSLSQVQMKTVATLHDLTAQKIVKNLQVTASTMDLVIDTNHLELKGDARIAGADASIRWQEFFDDGAQQKTALDVKGQVTPAVLRALDVNLDDYFAGSAASTATITRDRKNVTTVKLSADLSRSRITIPEVKLEKKPGVMGKLDLNLVTDDRGTTIRNTSMNWPRFNVSDASARFSDARGLESATLRNVRLGNSRGDIVVTPLAANGLRVAITGNELDLSEYWSQPKDPNAKPSNKRLELTMQVARLYLNRDVPISNARVNVVLQGSELLRGTASGQTDQNGSFALQQTINRDNSRRLAIKVHNAGRVFHALDITHAMRGGTLTLVGYSTPDKPSVISGDLRMDKFALVNAPILARLLNALSPGGLLNLLKTNGLNFSKMESQFSLPDADTIKFSKGRLAGDSLGLNFNGTVNRKTDRLDLRGTIIPVEGINKLAGSIPLIGRILTGSNKSGIIGATYRIRGPSGDPSVTVNPLSALAPGILRSIFFEGMPQ